MSYMNHSKSRHVKEAESEGKLPMSRAITVITTETPLSRSQARNVLEQVGTSEWHYTGRGSKKANYYDVGLVLTKIRRSGHVSA